MSPEVPVMDEAPDVLLPLVAPSLAQSLQLQPQFYRVRKRDKKFANDVSAFADTVT